MAYITKLAFMNEYYAYGRIIIWGSRVPTSSITYWKITIGNMICHGDLLGGQKLKKGRRKLA
jgi:hypothetical protein